MNNSRNDMLKSTELKNKIGLKKLIKKYSKGQKIYIRHAQ